MAAAVGLLRVRILVAALGARGATVASGLTAREVTSSVPLADRCARQGSRAAVCVVIAVISGDHSIRMQMVDKYIAGLSDSVTELSAKFERLEALVEGLTSEKPAVGQCAASAAAENSDIAGRRYVTRDEHQQR